MVTPGEVMGTVKSVNSREISHVTFVNRTKEPVNIIWRGFNEESIPYASDLAPEDDFEITTYVTHPWEARNSNTLKVLKIGGGSLFYPIPWKNPDVRAVIFIEEPNLPSNMESPRGTEGLIKSKSSGEPSFVTFFNRTRKPVDIIWRGFNGENFRYATQLAPTHRYNVNTFVDHPWQAWTSDTLRILNVGGAPVFYPIKWDRSDGRTVVFIDEPVSALLSLCLERVKSLVSVEDCDKLGIPRTLIDELKTRRTVEVRDHQGRR